MAERTIPLRLSDFSGPAPNVEKCQCWLCANEKAALAAEIERLRTRVTELEGQHKGLVLNNAILRERPDLPLNRIPAARAMTKLYEDNERLRAALERFACTCDRVGNAECSSGEVDCPFWQARAALEEGRT